MNPPPEPELDDDALVSAYLAGDLDDGEAAAVEARLRHDPAFAQRTDRMAALLVTLRGVDEVVPPEGYEERLRSRLAEERRMVRPRRARPRWSAGALAGVAAAVAAVGVLTVLPRQESLNMEAETPQMQEPGDARAGAAEEAADADESAQLHAGAERAPVPGGAAPAPLQAPAPVPVLADRGLVLDGEEEVREGFADLPEAVDLLGVTVDEARERAAAARAAVRDAPPFERGLEPARCLSAVLQGAPEAVVPARVEALRFAGEPALAYVLVGSESGRELDRVEVWVVSPACETRLFVTVG